MSIKPTKVQFNGGELSPWLQGRTDIAKYDKTAKLCRNFIPMVEGALKRRGGTHFVAQTPDDVDIEFSIHPNPAEARVFIDGVERSQIFVARGDKVTYEVVCDDYFATSGTLVVTENTSLNVTLIAKSQMVTLTIVPSPSDATVLLNGYQRHSINVPKNSSVVYQVYKDGYIVKYGTVVVENDKSLSVSLEQDEQALVDYGDWGTLEKFVNCSMSFVFSTLYRCFLIKFSKGYLGVIFPINQVAPDKNAVLDETKFFFDTYDLYNAVIYLYDHFAPIVMVSDLTGGFYPVLYYSKDGVLVGGTDVYSIQTLNWPKNDKGQWITTFTDYVGVINGNILKVYYQGNLVWELKGRNNV